MPTPLGIALLMNCVGPSLPGVHAATLVSFDLSASAVVVRCDTAVPEPGWGLLLSSSGLAAVAWGEFERGAARSDGFHGRFRLVGSPNALTETSDPDWVAWLVAPDLGILASENWPGGTSPHATILDVSPGARSAWLHAYGPAGTLTESTLWIRERGQPIARLDVLSTPPPAATTRPTTAPESSDSTSAPHTARRTARGQSVFCAITPLVADVRELRTHRPALWPSPADRRDGIVRSAVVYAEPLGDAQMLWLAAPRGIACPPEPRVELFRDGRFIVSAVVEQRDDRFWYARSSASAAGEGGPVREGDDARIRSQRDVDERRITARVFALRPDGALITAGEIDGVAAGDTCAILRGGVQVGQAVITRAQRDYAHARAMGVGPRPDPRPADRLAAQAQGPVALALGDEVDFYSQRVAGPSLEVVGHVDAVDHSAFRVVLARDGPRPVERLLALYAGGCPVGVAVLTAVNSEVGVGVALPGSMDGNVCVGWTLCLETAADAR